MNFPLWLRASLFLGKFRDQTKNNSIFVMEFILLFFFFCFLAGVDDGGGHVIFPEPLHFIQEVLKLKRVVLSIRWVAHKCAWWDKGAYKDENTMDAYKLLEDAKVLQMKDQEINFCLRGHYVHRSREALAKLFGKVNTTNRVTVTIYEDEPYWENEDPNCKTTPLITEEVREAIMLFGRENVYLQIGPDTIPELRLTGC